MTTSTAKPIFFVCLLFCEFRDLAKITGHEYLKYHVIFSVTKFSKQKFQIKDAKVI